MYKKGQQQSAAPSPATQPDRVQAKKSLGQNFLTSAVVPRFMCDAGQVGMGDTVLEIGPGTGVLTRELLARGATVIAIETDNRLVDLLTEMFATEIKDRRLTLITGDIRTTPIANYLTSTPYKVVANIPYYLSGFLLRIMLETTPPPSTLVFLMQKEVVERIARDKKSSLPSLAAAVFGTPRYVRTVGRGHFSPSPKVDSAILAITDISHTALPRVEDRALFFSLLHTGLRSKRKQLMGNLHPLVPRSVTGTFLETHGLPLTSRGEDLSVTTWLALFGVVKPYLKEV